MIQETTFTRTTFVLARDNNNNNTNDNDSNHNNSNNNDTQRRRGQAPRHRQKKIDTEEYMEKEIDIVGSKIEMVTEIGIPASGKKNISPEKKALGEISVRDTKSVAGEEFMLLRQRLARKEHLFYRHRDHAICF